MNFILIALIVLGSIALVAAVVLYVCSKKFAVHEDPRLAQVTAILPGANCGGCGYPGCSGMAAALVKGADAGSLDGLFVQSAEVTLWGKLLIYLAWLYLTQNLKSLLLDVTVHVSFVRILPNTMVCVHALQ